ncbi:hypothetical protein AVEN_81994-1 [Araneus ventricosus]|uniref:Uncharacterized protein n=1 Tax=Araneus ventricosus TaxID=182803 RepID=A0A4Y2IZE4_ARAVE|nr:hypothetical protein AVEN_81994-1 [Araneus ventricosus]
MQFLPSFQGLPKPTKNLNGYCGSSLHRRGTLFQWPEGWWDGCNILEKHLIGRSKEEDRDFSTVPTGSCNCVCVLGRYSTTRCSADQISTAINPQRWLWDAEEWTLGTGLFYLFALEKLTIEEEFFFSLPHFLGGPNYLLLKGAHLPWGKLATPPVRHC